MKAEELRARAEALYAYDPLTGHFWWRNQPKAGRSKVGMPAGWICKLGYRLLKIDSRSYYAHRLAWLLVHGEMPRMLDHKNCVKDDNRIINLRVANEERNGANRGKPASNTSGLKGVYRQNGKWKASITYGQKQYHLGMFASKEEAHAAYCARARAVFGEYWRA